MPLLPCPHCSHRIEVAVSRAGAEIECPACHQSVAVPKLGELRQLDSSSQKPSPVSASGAALGRRVAFVALLAIAAIASIIAAFGFIRAATITVPETTAGHIAEMSRIYSEVPAAQLVREWQHMETFHPETAAPHSYKLIADEKARWLRQGLIGLAVAAISAVAATLLIMLQPKKIS